jgi:protein-S-isoprenylcysteine O-methyltransferase Ste14
MYLGHLIFMAGIAVTFRSFGALAVLVFHCWWFNRRAVADEAFMRQRFDEQFEKYAGTVKRWGVF